MDKQLVRELEDICGDLELTGPDYEQRCRDAEVIRRAISYINATPSRDEVPEEALAKCKELHHRLAGKSALSSDGSDGAWRCHEAIRALKSAPNTKEAPQPEKFVPKDAGTQAQIAAVMLATGTPEQQAEVLAHMASEARVVAQPEKPGLVADYDARVAYGDWPMYTEEEQQRMIMGMIQSYITRRLAELDARQGEK